MGRRSTKTTKAGKFMNPTDQFRKEQRKKELKKNKKQRLVVREAVLRMKDVGQMLAEIEEIEEQELKNFGQPQHNEKGLEEKKSKLHASIHRVARYYVSEYDGKAWPVRVHLFVSVQQQEEPKKAQELKLMIMESEQRRREMSRVYNSYTAARSKYSIEDIPMPDSSEGGVSGIPMPVAPGLSEEQRSHLSGPLPPPPPPGSPPPDLIEYNVIESSGAKSVRFAEQAAQPISVLDKPADAGSSDEDSESEASTGEDDEEDDAKEREEVAKLPRKAPPGPPPGQPPTLLRVPPPAPPGPPPLFPPHFGMPPGLPPAPPSFGSVPRPLMMPPQVHSQAVLSAPPTRIKSGSKPAGAVISAQPQLRNMTAEVTKFMPTSLRVRRDHPKVNKPKMKLGQQEPTQQISGRSQGVGSGMQGDAYDTFMHEMQGLL